MISASAPDGPRECLTICQASCASGRVASARPGSSRRRRRLGRADIDSRHDGDQAGKGLLIDGTARPPGQSFELLKLTLTRIAFEDEAFAAEDAESGGRCRSIANGAAVGGTAPVRRRNDDRARAALHQLQHAVRDRARDGVPGDLIETGVWRGGACILMRAVLAAHGGPPDVWVADSFRGLPPPDTALRRRGGEIPSPMADLAVSRNRCGKLPPLPLLDEQVRFLNGWFRDTLPGAPVRAPRAAAPRRRHVRIDDGRARPLPEAVARRLRDRRRLRRDRRCRRRSTTTARRTASVSRSNRWTGRACTRRRQRTGDRQSDLCQGGRSRRCCRCSSPHRSKKGRSSGPPTLLPAQLPV